VRRGSRSSRVSLRCLAVDAGGRRLFTAVGFGTRTGQQSDRRNRAGLSARDCRLVAHDEERMLAKFSKPRGLPWHRTAMTVVAHFLR
jgi:hypothetical protein